MLGLTRIVFVVSFIAQFQPLFVNAAPPRPSSTKEPATKVSYNHVKNADGSTPLSTPRDQSHAQDKIQRLHAKEINKLNYQFRRKNGEMITVSAPTNSSATPRHINTRADTQVSVMTSCLDSSKNETHINNLFIAGGTGATVFLCPNAIINITNYIAFQSPNQTLATLGFPTGHTRALIRIVNGTQVVGQVNAVYGFYYSTSGCALRNIQIDGNRPALGVGSEPYAMVEMGGGSINQIIDNCHLYNGRGWSILHAAEGPYSQVDGRPICRSMKIINNQIGPSGTAPTGVDQFPAVMNVADGISLACLNSVVANNIITDATDGAIVIFSSEGNQVVNNTIIASNSTLLGGINMVDYNPMAGSFARTLVQGNTINAKSAMIKIGIPIGQMTWSLGGSFPSQYWLRGGAQVLNNNFISGVNGSTGYFGFLIAISSTLDFVVKGNTNSGAIVGGVKTWACPGTYKGYGTFPSMPSQQNFVYGGVNMTNYNSTAPDSLIQSDFVSTTWASLLICLAPNIWKGNPYTWDTVAPM